MWALGLLLSGNAEFNYPNSYWIGSFITALVIFGCAWFVLDRLSKYKSKLIALKEFRDSEMVRLINHVNAQLKGHEDRLSELDNIEQTEPTAEELRTWEESEKAKKKDIEQYNRAFSDWELGYYGKGEHQTIYKKRGYGT